MYTFYKNLNRNTIRVKVLKEHSLFVSVLISSTHDDKFELYKLFMPRLKYYEING